MNKKNNTTNVQKLVGTAVLTAIVIILQFLGSFIRFGPFSVSLVLIPIVVGAAMYGVAAGAWLGFVFGLVVLLSGDAAAFLAVNVPGTILTVLLKGTLAGLCAAVVYRLFSKINGFFATVAAAVICPVVNTGIFIIGCHLFFMETISGWAEAAGFKNAGAFIIVGMIGLNFVFELLINVILSPVIVRILRIIKKPSQETA